MQIRNKPDSQNKTGGIPTQHPQLNLQIKHNYLLGERSAVSSWRNWKISDQDKL